MKTKTAYLTYSTIKKIEIIRITDDVEQVVAESGVQEGLVLVNSMHITAAIVVNSNESGLRHDYIRTLEHRVTYNEKYEHNVGEDNAAAHIWRQLMAHQVVLPITEGKLDFGSWEEIFYFEFDGQRKKRVLAYPNKLVNNDCS